jgi:hypothetical protein
LGRLCWGTHRHALRWVLVTDCTTHTQATLGYSQACATVGTSNRLC